MSCPTCSHTMMALGCRTSDSPFYICPRCGTAKTCDGVVCVPALVDFCRRFGVEVWASSSARNTVSTDELDAIWNRLGIRDSINLPAARP